MPFKIQRFFFCLRALCVSQRLQFAPFGVVAFAIIAVPPNNVGAQFPGVGSEAPYGEATEAGDDVASDANYADSSVNEVGNSVSVDPVSTVTSEVSDQSSDNGDSSSGRPSDIGVSTLNLKKKHHRKPLFVQKLRLEFAAMQLVERKTGLPFSRDDVPRYLNELRSDLKNVVAGGEKAKLWRVHSKVLPVILILLRQN